MKKQLALVLICAFLLSLAVACTAPQAPAAPSAAPAAEPAPVPEKTTKPAPAPLRIAALKGPTGMGIVALMEPQYANQYAITIASAPDEVTAGIISGNLDIAAVPTNLASVLYNKLEGDVVMLAVNTLGVLYVLEDGDTIHSLADLSGKTLYATGQGATPEYALNFLLEKNGLSDVTVEYYSEHSELATLMASGDVKLGMLPEPNVTATMAQNETLRIALDLTEEWNKVSDTTMVMGCIIARKSAIAGNEAAIKQFLTDYAASTAFVNKKHQMASQLIAQYGIIPKAELAQKAIPKCNIVCLTGDEMRTAAQGMLQVLFDADPKSVGGALPQQDFYWSE
ncbi:MAG: ABC transporter substrate-binding protein [Christensenellaceae bacterium]|jgi:NitT/TauT family transport system substrate-binding protein|nr:ABC transporter substrate-binding protein [Christensenellaceae bacterium]